MIRKVMVFLATTSVLVFGLSKDELKARIGSAIVDVKKAEKKRVEKAILDEPPVKEAYLMGGAVGGGLHKKYEAEYEEYNRR